MFFKVYWFIWFVFVLASFSIVEYIAVHDGVPGGTLSECIWGLLQHVFSPWWFIFAGAFTFFGIWLTIHFLSLGKLGI